MNMKKFEKKTQRNINHRTNNAYGLCVECAWHTYAPTLDPTLMTRVIYMWCRCGDDWCSGHTEVCGEYRPMRSIPTSSRKDYINKQGSSRKKVVKSRRYHYIISPSKSINI